MTRLLLFFCGSFAMLALARGQPEPVALFDITMAGVFAWRGLSSSFSSRGK